MFSSDQKQKQKNIHVPTFDDHQCVYLVKNATKLKMTKSTTPAIGKAKLKVDVEGIKLKRQFKTWNGIWTSKRQEKISKSLLVLEF